LIDGPRAGDPPPGFGGLLPSFLPSFLPTFLSYQPATHGPPRPPPPPPPPRGGGGGGGGGGGAREATWKPRFWSWQRRQGGLLASLAVCGRGGYVLPFPSLPSFHTYTAGDAQKCALGLLLLSLARPTMASASPPPHSPI
jgi:hypothetical protein